MLHPDAGQKEPWKGSFSEIVRKEMDFRAKNPTLVQKHGWSLDPNDVANDVDLYNAQRMVAGGFFNFVDLEGPMPAQKKTQMGAFRNFASGVAAVKTALAIYRDLFGPEGKVVPKQESERRAAICETCPGNDVTGGLKKYFVEKAAAELMSVFGMQKDLDVTTSRDDKLGICKFCDCALKSKVHVENAVLKKHIKPEQISNLAPQCWIPEAIA